MPAHMRPRRLLFLVLLVMMLIIPGCAQRTYLIVDYQLPPDADLLDGQQVRLEVKDLRKGGQTLTPAAAAEFQGFNERFNLAWIKSNNERERAGNFDLRDLFGEAFRKRLEMQAVHVMRSSLGSAPLLQIELRTLTIDLKNHNWTAQMSCRVILSGDNQVIATQEVTGTAERAKIIGRKGADTVFSELFTDLINRVDFGNLFRQAKLM